MAPSGTPPSPGAAPLPPLPTLSGGGSSPAPGGSMSDLVSGLAPVKKGVEMIQAGVQLIVKSGAAPGWETMGGQIVALAQTAIPMSAQQMLGASQGGASAPPPPQGIPPVGGGQGGM